MTDRERLLEAVGKALPGATLGRVLALLVDEPGGVSDAVAASCIAVRDLEERVKELTALHGTAALLHEESPGVPEILGRVAALLPPAFLHPEHAVARVSCGDDARSTPGWRETPWLLRSGFRTYDGREGALEVAYLVDLPGEAEGPFLRQERELLDSLARMLTAALGRRHLEECMRLFVGTGMVRLFEWDVARDRYSWPGIPATGEGGEKEPMTLGREEVDRRIHADDLPDLRRRVDAALADPACARFHAEYRAALVPGEFRWRQLVGIVVRGAEGRAERLLGITVDISERKELEETLRQSRKLEALGQLAGGMAHDFNNILVAILGFAEMARHRVPEGDPGRTYLQEIDRAGGSAAALVKQVLAFARRQELRPRAVDLPAALAAMEGMLATLVTKLNVLVLEADPGVPPARVDPHQLQQVVLNLCVNARDAMPEGGRITLRVRRAARGAPREDGSRGEPREWVVLDVEDTGRGMPPEVRDRMFEPFFTTKGEGKGTGLGLATVHGIVTQSGGFLDVESEVGRGTAVRVFLPIAG